MRPVLRLLALLGGRPNLTPDGSFDTGLGAWSGGADSTAVVVAWDSGNGGRAKLTRGADSNAGGLTRTIQTIPDQWYSIRFTATAGAGGSGVAFRVDSGVFGTVVPGAGTFVYHFKATGPTAAPYFWNISNNAIDYVDSIQVRRVGASPT